MTKCPPYNCEFTLQVRQKLVIFLFFNSCFTSMCNPLGYDRPAQLFLHEYSSLVRYSLFFPLVVAIKFTTFGLYRPEIYPYLLLNHKADFLLPGRFSAPIRDLFPRLLLDYQLLSLKNFSNGPTTHSFASRVASHFFSDRVCRLMPCALSSLVSFLLSFLHRRDSV